MDQGSPNLAGYYSIPASTLPSVRELYGADRTRYHRFWLHPYCCPLLKSNSCPFFLGSPFPSLPVSSPRACSKPPLLNCLHVFFKMKGLYKQNPASARLKLLKQAFSSRRRPKHIHSLIGTLADTQLTPLLLYFR